MKKQLDKEQIKEAKKLGYKGGYTIGDLIEFLDENNPYYFYNHWIGKSGYDDENMWGIELDRNGEEEWPKGTHKELCDAIWQAVKGILEG